MATTAFVYFILSLIFSEELLRRFRIDMTSVFLRLMARASTVLVDEDVAPLAFSTFEFGLELACNRPGKAFDVGMLDVDDVSN